MTVKVSTIGTGGQEKVLAQRAGDGLDVRESGHLVVTDGVDIVAIYAPGSWTSAEIVK